MNVQNSPARRRFSILRTRHCTLFSPLRLLRFHMNNTRHRDRSFLITESEASSRSSKE
jgi:hypothetical protein